MRESDENRIGSRICAADVVDAADAVGLATGLDAVECAVALAALG